MPINYFQPLDSLRNLPQSGFKYKAPDYGVDSTDDISVGTPNDDSGVAQFHADPNSNLELASLQDQRQSELKDNAAKGLIMAAPQNSQRELDADINANPLTTQRSQVNDYLAKSRASQMSGFSTPQEEAGYTQRQAEAKQAQPLEIAKANNNSEIEKQRIASKGAVDVANIAADTRGAQLTALQSLLAGNGGGLKPGQHVGMTGQGISVSGGSQPQRIPSAQLVMVQKARDAANKAGYFQKGRADQSLKSAIATALTQHPASGRIKSFAQQVASDPKASKMPTQDLLDQIDLSDFTPEEVDALPDLLSIIRGQ